jgi:hypothetical protein
MWLTVREGSTALFLMKFRSHEMAPFLMPLDRDTGRSQRTRVLASIMHGKLT